MSKQGKRLLKSAKEALAIAKGEIVPARVYDDIDVAKICAKLKMSQAEFAELLSVSKRVIQDWEQHRKTPSGAARALLRIAAKAPATVRKALAA